MTDDRFVAIRVTMLPKDTNPLGTIFGGVILSYIDLAAGIQVAKHTHQTFVTKAMKEVVFVAPVQLGDLVTFYTQTSRIGRTSITVHVEVEVERLGPHGNRETVRVTEADVVFVTIDATGRPTPIVEQ